MYRAFLQKDFFVLKFRSRSFVGLALAAVVLLTLTYFSSTRDSFGAMIFGSDFVRLFLLSLVGLMAFLEHYTASLAADKNDGILAILILCGKSRLAYSLVKVVVPLALAIVASGVTIAVYLAFLAGTGFSWSAALSFLEIIGSELVLAMGFGMALNVTTGVDIKQTPGVVYALILVNAPLLYFLNPMNHLASFCAATVGCGIVSYAIAFVLMRRAYRNNLSQK